MFISNNGYNISQGNRNTNMFNYGKRMSKGGLAKNPARSAIL